MKFFLIIALCFSSFANAVETIVQASKGLPITTFNVTFRVGSADDPKGKEGLANLTAALLREGGVKAWGGFPARSRAEMEEFLFPKASEISITVSKEQIAITATASEAEAETILGILSQMILAPKLDATELERLRSETLDALTKQFPREDQEELGKAALDRWLYGDDHPYSHVVEGTVASVKSITTDDIVAFHKAFFNRKRATVGIAGMASLSLREKVRKYFAQLPNGDSVRAKIAKAPDLGSKKLLIVKGPFEATGVHLGIPLNFTRRDLDFPAMYMTSAAFGKHRSFVGRLMQNVRELRGLNYGCYSYVEDFPHGGSTTEEPVQAARSRQAFTVWGRPTTQENGCFLLRQVVREVTQLATEGLSVAEFELGKGHVIGNLPLLATSLDRRLGYAIDAEFYGIREDYLSAMQRKTKFLNRQLVNRVIRKNLNLKELRMVVVTPEPDKFIEEILSPKCGIKYAEGITKSKEILAEDEKISTFGLGLTKDQIAVIDSDWLFASATKQSPTLK